MRAVWICWISLALILGGLNLSAAPAKKITAKRIAPKRVTPKKASATKAKSSIKRSPGVKSSITKKTTKRPAKRRYTSKIKRRAPVRRGQAAPAEDRIREIQSALKDRGYFEGEPNGKWGDSSVAALKRFQEEQNLRPDGKIGSLSLIALGLGPKRGGATAAPEVPVPAATAAEQPQAQQ